MLTKPLGEHMENNSCPTRKLRAVKEADASRGNEIPVIGNFKSQSMPENNEMIHELGREGSFVIPKKSDYENSSAKSSPVSSSDDDYESFTAHIRNSQKSSSPCLSKRRSNKIESTESTNNSKTGGLRVRPRQVVIIQDFDFLPKTIEISEDNSVEFRLAFDLPSHAEHCLQGVSSVAGNCFTSPTLQVNATII